MGKENFYYITVNGVKKELSDRLTKLYEESPCNTKSALMLYVIEKRAECHRCPKGDEKQRGACQSLKAPGTNRGKAETTAFGNLQGFQGN